MSILASLFIKKCNEILPPAPKKQRVAENIIINNKIRPLEVEMLYNKVKYQFSCNMKRGELKRWNILQIRNYLEESVKEYEHKRFKNDAHAIYAMLKSKDLTTEHLSIVRRMLR